MSINLSQLNNVIAHSLRLPTNLNVVVLADPKAKPLLRDRKPRPRSLHGRYKVVVEPGFNEWARDGGIRSVRDLIDAIGAWVHFARDGRPLGADRVIIMRNGRRVSGKTLLA